VQSELHQLLSWTTGNGVLAQISMKAIKRVGTDLINVSFRYVHLSVVVFKKQFVLNTLTEYIFVDIIELRTRLMPVLCFHLWLVSLCRFFYIILNRQCLRNN